MSAPDAVCPHCEPELSGAYTFMDGVTVPASSQADSHGPHACPWCGWRFQAPICVTTAPGTPWWKPADLCPQCPHCKGWLVDTQPPVSIWIFLLIYGLATIGGHYARRYHPYLQPVAVLLVVVVLGLAYRRYRIRREKSQPQLHRYARWQGQVAQEK